MNYEKYVEGRENTEFEMDLWWSRLRIGGKGEGWLSIVG